MADDARTRADSDIEGIKTAWENILETRIAEKQKFGKVSGDSDRGMQLSKLSVPEDDLFPEAVKDASEQLLDLTMKLDASEAARVEAMKRMDALDREVNRLRSMADLSDQMRRDAEARTSQTRPAGEAPAPDQAVEALRQERDALKHDLADLQAQMTKAREGEADSEALIGEADRRIAELEVEVARLTGDSARGKGRPEDGSATLGQDEIDKVVGAIIHDGAKQDEETLNRLRAEIQDLRLKTATAERSREEFEARATRSAQRVSELERTVGDLQRSVGDLRDRLAAAEKLRRTSEQRCMELEFEAVQLRSRQAGPSAAQVDGNGHHGSNGAEAAELRRRLQEAYGIIKAIEDAYLAGRMRRTRLPGGGR